MTVLGLEKKSIDRLKRSKQYLYWARWKEGDRHLISFEPWHYWTLEKKAIDRLISVGQCSTGRLKRMRSIIYSGWKKVTAGVHVGVYSLIDCELKCALSKKKINSRTPTYYRWTHNDVPHQGYRFLLFRSNTVPHVHQSKANPKKEERNLWESS